MTLNSECRKRTKSRQLLTERSSECIVNTSTPDLEGAPDEHMKTTIALQLLLGLGKADNPLATVCDWYLTEKHFTIILFKRLTTRFISLLRAYI